MIIVFVTKSKNEIKMECEDFNYQKQNGRMTSWTATGVTKNKILYIDMNNIDYIYRED